MLSSMIHSVVRRIMVHSIVALCVQWAVALERQSTRGQPFRADDLDLFEWARQRDKISALHWLQGDARLVRSTTWSRPNIPSNDKRLLRKEARVDADLVRRAKLSRRGPRIDADGRHNTNQVSDFKSPARRETIAKVSLVELNVNFDWQILSIMNLCVIVLLTAFGAILFCSKLYLPSDGVFDSDIETCVEPKRLYRERGMAVSAAVHGPSNEWLAKIPSSLQKSDEHTQIIIEALRKTVAFMDHDDEDLHALCNVMRYIKVDDQTQISFQDSLYILLEGTAAKTSLASGVIRHDIADVGPGAVLGETAMLHKTPPRYSIVAKGPCLMSILEAEVYQNIVTLDRIRQREKQLSIMRNVKVLETLTDEQLMSLIDVMRKSCYRAGDNIVTQGEAGNEFFVIQRGICVVTVTTGNDVQTVTEYNEGDLFGELAILNDVPRAATVTAKTACVEILSLSRSQFERLMGPMTKLIQSHYIKDPRKILADFYLPGDQHGPLGCGSTAEQHTAAAIAQPDQARLPPKKTLMSLLSFNERPTEWFAVYRPTSRDAIQKMLAGIAVGKGLNVKGKSAKKGCRSGYVPFLQIFTDEHKAQVEISPVSAQVTIYFKTWAARDVAIKSLETMLDVEVVSDYFSNRQSQLAIERVDSYAPYSYGIYASEHLVREVYIMRPCLTPPVGWETGRNSQPAFMNMNLHALREDSKPKAVLYQSDEANPMNPHGLLMAYAEDFVKPVVSDFDTFLVGSRGMAYGSMPSEQVNLMGWTVEKAAIVLKRMGKEPSLDWTTAWLALLEDDINNGLSFPEMPAFGWGDPVSTRLTSAVVKSTVDCGAVRHGAESFNLTLPCELDDEYLIIWQHFPEKPWKYVSEPELRAFLLDRIHDEYTFPVNPVWALRDEGWYEILSELRAAPHAEASLEGWLPSHILMRIDALSDELRVPSAAGSYKRTSLERDRQDLDPFESMQLNVHELQCAKWRAKNKLRAMVLLSQQRGSRSRKPSSERKLPR